MASVLVLRLVVLGALFLAIQGEDGRSEQHIQTQQDRNDAMKVFKKDLSKKLEECNRKHSSNLELTLVMLESRIEYRAGKCFLHCMLNAYDMVNTLGKLGIDVIRRSAEMIPSERTRGLVLESLEGCVAQGNRVKDKCNQAYKLSECLYRNAYKPDNTTRHD